MVLSVEVHLHYKLCVDFYLGNLTAHMVDWILSTCVHVCYMCAIDCMSDIECHTVV